MIGTRLFYSSQQPESFDEEGYSKLEYKELAPLNVETPKVKKKIIPYNCLNYACILNNKDEKK